jgi:hypothetical protein
LLSARGEHYVARDKKINRPVFSPLPNSPGSVCKSIERFSAAAHGKVGAGTAQLFIEMAPDFIQEHRRDGKWNRTIAIPRHGCCCGAAGDLS